ncbi:MAG: FdtA/QdtA family cupin domain-containing protein [Idiomarina sp.]
MLAQVMHMDIKSDGRGNLVALEGERSVPFAIKRVYYLTEVSGHQRGFHAHRNLHQLAICLHGSCRFVLDNGYERESVYLDNPAKGLFIDNLIWREMHDFSDDCVLMVLASDYYDEADYIRNYDVFLEEVKNSSNKSE